MLIDTAMNSTNGSFPVPGGAKSPYMPRASSVPSSNGSAMPAWETATAVLLLPRRDLRSSSSPTRNMNTSRPMFPSTPMYGSADCGNSHAWPAGQSQPSRDGPNRMPTSISPTTAGCPSRLSNWAPALQARITTGTATSRGVSGSGAAAAIAFSCERGGTCPFFGGAGNCAISHDGAAVTRHPHGARRCAASAAIRGGPATGSMWLIAPTRRSRKSNTAPRPLRARCRRRNFQVP